MCFPQQTVKKILPTAKRKEKTYLMFSLSECIPWITVGLAESVAIVTINLTAIIIFVKNRNRCKRGTYLMINLAVVDMLAGVSAGISLFYFAGNYYCNLWKWYSYEDWEYYIVFTLEFLFPLASLIDITAIAFERFHATFWPHKYRVLKKWKYVIIITVVWTTAGLLFTACAVLIEFTRSSYYIHFSNSFLFNLFVDHLHLVGARCY